MQTERESENRGEEAENNVLRVFLSHKEADKDLAVRIKRELELHADRLRVYVSGFKESGRNWRQYIKSKLIKADWLILLYTESKRDWGWCLFESGFFEGKQLGARDRRLFVVHAHDTDRPKPLEEFQSIPVRPALGDIGEFTETDHISVLSFVRTLYGEPFRPGIKPLNSRLAADQAAVNRISNVLCETIGTRPVETQRFLNRVKIRIDRTAWKSNRNRIPADSDVSGDLSSLDIPRANVQWWVAWRTIQQRFGHADAVNWAEGWLTCLETLIGRAIENHFPLECVLPVLRDQKNPSCTFRFVLDHCRAYAQGRLEFEFLMIKMPSITSRYADIDISRVGNLVYMGRMLRWGAIDPAISETSALLSNGNADARIEVLTNRYRELIERIDLNIKTEVQASGYERGRSLRAMGNNHQRASMDGLFAEWDDLLKNRLRSAMCERGDIDDSLRLLGELKDVTKKWMVLCSKRFHELASELH